MSHVVLVNFRRDTCCRSHLTPDVPAGRQVEEHTTSESWRALRRGAGIQKDQHQTKKCNSQSCMASPPNGSSSTRELRGKYRLWLRVIALGGTAWVSRARYRSNLTKWFLWVNIDLPPFLRTPVKCSISKQVSA